MIRLFLCLKNEVAKIVFFGIRPPFFRNFFFKSLFVTHFLIVGAWGVRRHKSQISNHKSQVTKKMYLCGVF